MCGGVLTPHGEEVKALFVCVCMLKVLLTLWGPTSDYTLSFCWSFE